MSTSPGVMDVQLGAMRFRRIPPSTDLWTCEHGIGYPEMCKGCLMTGKVMYERFNTAIGFSAAVQFGELPPLFKDAWNDLAAYRDGVIAGREEVGNGRKEETTRGQSVHSVRNCETIDTEENTVSSGRK